MLRKLADTRKISAIMRLRYALAALLCVLVVAVAIVVIPITRGANPASGTVSEANPLVSWSGAIMAADPDLLTSPRCNGADPCDNFSLTVVPPPASFGPYIVEIRLRPQGDWDLELYNPDGKYRTSSGNGAYANEVVVLFNPPAGTYRIAAFPFSPVVGSDGNSYAATAQLLPQPPSGSAPAGTANVGYTNFPCPVGQTCTSGFGEPSIGVNWKTGNVMFAGGGTLKTFRINNFNDQAATPTATWTNVSGNQHTATTPRAAADPILFTDPQTGRTFADQLEGLTPFSTLEYSDDDGNLFLPSQGSGLASGIDHQTIGGGPLAPPLTRDPSLPAPYPNGLYYCAQGLGPANCALSLDGGTTFGPAVPMWITECGGLHGHVKVSPVDGTAYVPNRGCDGLQGMAVSTDNGITWTIRTIPNTGPSESDPSIGIATDGTVYFGFVNGDGHPEIAVSHDKGATWDTWNSDRGAAAFIDVGTPFGIQNAAFAEVVAGDPDRAAFAFHGSTTAGTFQDPSFNGVWNLYVAHTYDGGRTWTTVKATSDPTQRGCIWLGGGSNPCRNLLDFMDATIDAQGRVLVGFADGCTGACATGPANTAKSVWATIARQSNGLGLFSAFDPKGLTEQNVNSLVALQVTNPASASGISSFNLAIKDTSTQTISTPLRAEVAQLTSASGRVTVANADNSLSGAGANWSYDSLVGNDSALSAAEVSGMRSLRFRNPNNESFTVTFNVFGNLPYSGPSCCSPSGASSSGGSAGSGGSSTSSSSPSISGAANLVYQLTYNPVLNSITVQLIGPR
ncbi:MAG: hypothetical protein QOF62_715 [Pyrinomonadaceae bacterium]|jgi:hypothetical protein|nr:hypothetical protein [Pyrinomonadaceae bacterium]